MAEDYGQIVHEMSGDIKEFELNEDLSYYNAENRMTAIGVAVPPQMRKLLARVGWPRTYVDSIEERLDVEGFRVGPDDSNKSQLLRDWWQSNQLDVDSGLGHIDAMIHGRAYITISRPSPDDIMIPSDTPLIHVESPYNLVTDVDPRTRQVRKAVRVYQDETTGTRLKAATLYLPNQTVYLEYQNTGWVVTGADGHNLGIVPVVPLVNRARLSDRTGYSEILPELRSVTDAAARIMMDMQAAAELMAVPQRLLFGVTAEALQSNPNDPASVLDSYYSKIIALEEPDASATQFNAAELMNFVNSLQELSKQAASYTGLPPQYLSFSSENPASAEAIKAAEARLVKKCERKGRMFGESWEQAMKIALRMMGRDIGQDDNRIEAVWRDPSTPTYASKADAVSKLVSTTTADGRSILPLEQARDELGYGPEQRKAMREEDQQTPTAQLSQLVGSGPRQQIPSPVNRGDDGGPE